MPVPRTPRISFPSVHSLYLSEEQDARLRRFAERRGRTASELMRRALDEYLARTTPKPEPTGPTRAETREAIAAAARARRASRGPGYAPPWRGQRVEDGTPVWQP